MQTLPPKSVGTVKAARHEMDFLAPISRYLHLGLMNLEKRATSHYVRKPVFAVNASDIFAFSRCDVSTTASPSSLLFSVIFCLMQDHATHPSVVFAHGNNGRARQTVAFQKQT